MADRIFTVSPTFTQDFDGSWHTLGNLFTVSVAARLVGGRIRYPTSDPANLVWVVYRITGPTTGVVVASLDCDAHFGAGAVNSEWNSFTSADFDTPGDVDLDPAEEYVVCYATNGDFVLDGGYSYPVGDGIAVATEGRYHDGGAGAVFPENSEATAFGADVEVEPDEAEPVVIDWTSVQLRLTPQALTATPGMVTVAWTTVSLALTVVAPAVTPGMVTVAWTPVELRLAVVAPAATPGMVTVAWTTVGLTLTVVTATVTPGMVNVAWSTVTMHLVPQPLALATGAVTIAWTTIVLAFTARPFTIEMLIEPGLATPAGSVLALTASGVVHIPTPAGAVTTPVASGRP